LFAKISTLLKNKIFLANIFILEMIVKAKLNNYKVGEIPTIWIDRSFGESKFKFKKFIPSYIYWVGRLITREK